MCARKRAEAGTIPERLGLFVVGLAAIAVAALAVAGTSWSKGDVGTMHAASAWAGIFCVVYCLWGVGFVLGGGESA